MNTHRARLHTGTVLVSCFVAGLAANGLDAQVTTTDYQRAEQFLGSNARSLISGEQFDPHWLDGDRFWYRSHTDRGNEFILVDPAGGTRNPAFDHARLAAALSVAADTAYEPFKLPFEVIELLDGSTIRFEVSDSIRWTCDITSSYSCTGPDTIPDPPLSEAMSPDSNWVAFARA